MATEDIWRLDSVEVERVHKRLAALDRQYRHALPDASWLRLAIETCFWASLQADESRGIRGSVAYARPVDCLQRIQLTSPIPLSADHIRDLLPAVHPGCAALAALGSDIWGVALQLPHDAFFITIVGPGQLLLRCGDRVMASLSGRALVELPDLHVVLADMFPRLKADVLRKLVIDASLLMRKIGHGGTVALLNELGRGLLPNRLVHPDSRYQTWTEETLAEATLKNEPENREMQARAGREQEHREQAKARLLQDVVQLTATDGLLALDGNLSVICFGAKIESMDVPAHIEVFDFGSPAPRAMAIQDLGGTRHQSAARLAWSRRDDALVLVVSQDGRCSLFARFERPEGPVLRVLRGFERAVPPDAMTLRFGSFVPMAGSA
jgi:hypothetical protein